MKVWYDYDLSEHNTFRMKVRCARYIEYESVEELSGLDVPESIQADHTVADLEDLACLLEMEGIVDTLELVEQDIGYLAGFNIVLRHSETVLNDSFILFH